jgi:hypothetical protein
MTPPTFEFLTDSLRDELADHPHKDEIIELYWEQLLDAET